MPSPKPYDTTINCSEDNPLCIINRGPVKVTILYEDIEDKESDIYAEVRVGKRRQRTALTAPHDQHILIKDVLSILGFQPEVATAPIEWDEKYD